MHGLALRVNHSSYSPMHECTTYTIQIILLSGDHKIDRSEINYEYSIHQDVMHVLGPNQLYLAVNKAAVVEKVKAMEKKQSSRSRKILTPSIDRDKATKSILVYVARGNHIMYTIFCSPSLATIYYKIFQHTHTLRVTERAK